MLKLRLSLDVFQVVLLKRHGIYSVFVVFSTLILLLLLF
jgi:hypothetical protein